MGRPHRRLLLAVSFLALTLPLALAPATSGSGQRTFRDTVGEVDCCTRDLTDVVVRNDDAGTITFEIHFDGQPEGDDDDDLFIPLDTDQNAATGERVDWGTGIDYMIGAHVWKGGADAITLYRWAGRGFRESFVRRIHVTSGAETIRVTLDRHLIGDTNGFRFNVQVWEVAHGAVYSDGAPDNGSWSFPLRIPRARFEAALETPTHPRAGKAFTARLALRARGTRRFLGSGRVLCKAAVGKAALTPAFAGFAGRRAVCIWNVPASARGKTILGSVGVAVTSRARISRRFAAVLS
jgi:hypothetical protein